MDRYGALIAILGIIFWVFFMIAICLTVRLLRTRSNSTKEQDPTESEPFVNWEKRPSLTGRENRKCWSDYSTWLTEDDDVFDEGDCALIDIAFSLFHLTTEEKLVVDIWSVNNTPADFTSGYLEVQLFPSDFEAGRFRTSERTCVDNAVIFNETLVLPSVRAEVLSRVHLKLFLYACNGSTRGQCVGHAVFSLRNIQFDSTLGKIQFSKKLIQHRMCESPPPTPDEEPSRSPNRDKGELYISLRYQKKSERINVVVLKAENIQKGGVLQNDSYVKIKLLFEGEVVDKKQTKAKKRGSNTCWNEPFAFNIDEEKGLHNYELVFLVRRRDLISPSASIGHVRIGPQVGGAGQSHWYAMMAKGNLMRQVARYHKIQ